jgi:hypothetical protein|uniref:Universal stress protein n=1 Tax=candidate division WOR-3 bacterium TaxID=2052148 RepID=A0A7V3V083_UNCW3
MFERILYIISEKQEEKETVLNFARSHNSTVVLSGVNPLDGCPPPRTEGVTRQAVRAEDHERRCWQNIYRIEEEFKQSGIRASVIANLTTIDNLQFLASSIRCDIIILPVSILADNDYHLPEELLPNLPCPLLLINNH